MRWGTIKIISLLGDRGSGHVRVAVTPLGLGLTTDEVRSGSRQKVGVTTVRVSSSLMDGAVKSSFFMYALKC